MTATAPDRSPVAPRTVLLLPAAVLLHQAEEWFGGFPAWSAVILGREIRPEQFLAVNALGLVLFAGGALAARRVPHLAWVGASFTTLIGVNGLLHAIASLVSGSYSPGTLTGLLLFVPLSAALLRSLSSRLTRPVFAGSVAAGVLVHAVATLSALG